MSMKTLYESLLDDEDVVMDAVDNILKDPLRNLYTQRKTYRNADDWNKNVALLEDLVRDDCDKILKSPLDGDKNKWLLGICRERGSNTFHVCISKNYKGSFLTYEIYPLPKKLDHITVQNVIISAFFTYSKYYQVSKRYQKMIDDWYEAYLDMKEGKGTKYYNYVNEK